LDIGSWKLEVDCYPASWRDSHPDGSSQDPIYPAALSHCHSLSNIRYPISPFSNSHSQSHLHSIPVPYAFPHPLPYSTSHCHLISHPHSIPNIQSPISFRGGLRLSPNGNDDIYLLNLLTGQVANLTAHPAEDRDPAWSPDGTRLAFASHRDGNWELYLWSAADGSVTRLTNHPAYDGAPTWSPDGTRLAFESYRDGNLEIYLLDLAADSEPVRLTNHRPGTTLQPGRLMVVMLPSPPGVTAIKKSTWPT
jgi:WD40 repeat protein